MSAWSKRLGQLSGAALVAIGAFVITRQQLTVIQDSPTGLWIALAGLFPPRPGDVRKRFGPRGRRPGRRRGRLMGASIRRPPRRRRAGTDERRTLRGIGQRAACGHRATHTYNAADVRVRDVMLPWTPDMTLDASTPLEQGLARLRATPGGVIVVLDERGVVRGVLNEDIVRTQLQTT